MNNAPVFVKAACGISLIQYIAHAWLFLSGKPMHDNDESALLNDMHTHQWKFSGIFRSYWDFYFGYGLIVIWWGIIQIVLLWLLTLMIKVKSGFSLWLLIIMMTAIAGHALLSFYYFFPAPVVFDLIVWLLLVGSLLSFSRSKKQISKQ